MPIPKKKPGESSDDFMSRCMSNPKMRQEYPDQKQRAAVCSQQSKSILEIASEFYYIDEYGTTEDITSSNFYMPPDEDYVDFGEDSEDVLIDDIVKSKYNYKDPKTGEVYTYERKGVYKKNGRFLTLVKGAEYQGKKVTLNKPFRTPKGPKKFAVYTKNESGNVVIVRFGDPNMKIKKSDPERRKSFRARHKCDNPGPKWKARYWACKAW